MQMINNYDIKEKREHLENAVMMITGKDNLSVNDLKPILEELEEYVLKVMERDIHYINISTRKQVASYIIECVNKGWEKGYFTSGNITDALLRIIHTCKSFIDIRHGDFGNCLYDYHLGFNFGNSFANRNMRHIIFHEVVHAFSNFFLSTVGFYKENSQKDKTYMKITSNSHNFIPIINYKFKSFLSEVIAEATACDLANTYSPSKIQVAPGIYSDWIVIYNREYQQLGYEFLRTISNDVNKDERQLFKELTIRIINGDNIGAEILKVYETKNPDTWKDDLHEITTVLGEIVTTHNWNIEKVNRVRELMKKYTPSIKVVSRNDTPSI